MFFCWISHISRKKGVWIEIYFYFSFSFVLTEHKCFGPVSPEPQQERCLCVWIPKTHLPASKIASRKRKEKKFLEQLVMKDDIKFDSEVSELSRPPVWSKLKGKRRCPSDRSDLTAVHWIAPLMSFLHFPEVITLKPKESRVHGVQMKMYVRRPRRPDGWSFTHRFLLLLYTHTLNIHEYIRGVNLCTIC